MTHDKLKATINNLFDKGFDAEIKNALHAVVELHKPVERGNYNTNEPYGLFCIACEVTSVYEPTYPCLTIQAIEKKLG